MEVTAYRQTAEILRQQVREAQLDYEAFEQKLMPCELSRCRATCCHDGVSLSEEEVNLITDLLGRHKSKLLAYKCQLPEKAIVSIKDGQKWKTATRNAKAHELADDFPKHFPKTKCVFLDPIGRCGLQRISKDMGHSSWYHKPLTCWLHPLVVLPVTRDRSRPLLTIVNAQNDPQKANNYPGFASCTHCGRHDEYGQPAREVLSAELEMLGVISGRDLLRELNAETI